MGMHISSSSSASGQTGAAAWQQRQQNMQALSKALQSNDLDAAKSAYQAMTQSASGGRTPPANSPLAQLGQALQSGDLGAAQKAMAAMKAGHGHHHADGDADGTQAAAAVPSSPTATLGNNLNVVA